MLPKYGMNRFNLSNHSIIKAKTYVSFLNNNVLTITRNFQKSSYKTTPYFALNKKLNNVPMLLNSNFLMVNRNIHRHKSGFVSILGRTLRLPAYFTGGVAAISSYVLYKLEEGGNKIKEFWGKSSDWFEEVFGDIELFGKTNDEGNNNNNNGNNDDVVVGATLLASMSGPQESEEDTKENEEEDDDEEELIDTTGDDMVSLTRQMIEIRSILNKISSSMGSTINLPSIVVIGSQSSGKSSVLESIVGKDFLPKGANMVTRRPIELTLINTSEEDIEENMPVTTSSKSIFKKKIMSVDNSEYLIDIPQLRQFNISDFNQVKRLLIDLNLQVPSTDFISEEPIELIIKSPKVPDLQLIDLPGYIQVESINQPIELKSKIRNLCDKYLQQPNIILAISSADVDLANSTSLQAARKADPKGERTLGVITKIDLVKPELARDVLLNKNYPLKMGYVGVINSKSSELDYFKKFKPYFESCQYSNKKLRKKLIKILETTMSKELKPTFIKLQQELDNTRYRFKVEYNDRQLTPRTHLSSQIDILKLSVKELQELFGRNELKSVLRQELDQEVLKILSTNYWKDLENENLKNIIINEESSSDQYWHKNVELASSTLTKLGIGRISTSIITNSIMSEINNILFVLQPESFKTEGFLYSLVNEIAIKVLNKKYYTTADQVENCIKPFKYEVDIEKREWDDSKNNSVLLLKEELKQVNNKKNELKSIINESMGNKQIHQLIQFIKQEKHRIVDESSNNRYDGGFSTTMLQLGTNFINLENREKLLKFRLKFISGKQCKDQKSMDKCPEIYLKAINEKLISTAVLFLNIELLSDFFYNFPIELDKEINKLSNEDVEMFAKQDSNINKHIELQKKKDLLELAINKMNNMLIYERINKK